MLKKIITIFIISCFISISVFAAVQVNSGNLGTEFELSNNAVPLSDQELEITNGLGFWECAEATVIYLGAVAGGAAATTVGGAAIAAIAIAAAYKNMKKKCSPFAQKYKKNIRCHNSFLKKKNCDIIKL